MGASQIGLLIDIVGFVIIFFTGGFTYGIAEYIENPTAPWILPLRIMGFVLAIGGFGFQFVGSM